MKAASVHELKLELSNTSAEQLVDLCVRLANSKKNKELLTYLLLKHLMKIPISKISTRMQQQFEEINKTNVYFVKKTLRKMLRLTNKYIRYTGSQS
jgi:hypothetical protein